MTIALAPMEGLVDALMRDLLTRLGGIDWCVTEFVRVSRQVLPDSHFLKLAPELTAGSKTPSGVPVHVQLLGSEPEVLAANALKACILGAQVVDLNFGCPTKTVNNSRGGAILLREPDLIHAIVSAVRAAVPDSVQVTAKMRLGYESPEESLACSQAIADAGASHLVVHARTRMEGYRPPAHWEWIARIQDHIHIPVIANGEIWSVADWQRCKSISGVQDVMLGRGLVARPDLAWQIAQAQAGEPVQALGWLELWPLVYEFWQKIQLKLEARYAPGCLKQWLGMLAWSYPEAEKLFAQIRREADCQRITALLMDSALAPTE